MSRIIREHRVYGKEILVVAKTEEAAKKAVRDRTSLHIWEIKEIRPQFWEAYVSDDAWALND